MKMYVLVAVAGVIAVAGLTGLWPSTVPAQTQVRATPPRWDYKQVENPSAKELATLGAESWEIVAVLGGQPYVKDSRVFGPAPGGGPVGGAPIISTTSNTIEYGKLVYVLKRPK
jgi:hypothetical protein